MLDSCALFAWGCDEDGQLGIARDDSRASLANESPNASSPVELRAFAGARVARIAAGSRNSFAVLANGTLHSWGWNSHRTLALSDDELAEVKTNAPREVSAAKDVRGVACGGWHACACSFDGSVLCWGGNEYNQCAFATTTEGNEEGDGGEATREWAPKKAAVFPPRRALGRERNVIEVTCGGFSSFALCKSGVVFEWGQTTEDDEPHGDPRALDCLGKAVLEISAGAFHLLLRCERDVLSYGNGMYGQLGLGATGASAAPRVIEHFGGDFEPKTVAAGGWHSACVSRSGELYCWGRGEYGRLGLGDDCRDKVVPQIVRVGTSNEGEMKFDAVSLGGSHSVALTRDGEVMSWGRNSLGRLGRVPRNASPACGFPERVIFPPLPDGAYWRVTQISAGGRHTLALATKTRPS